MYFSFTASLPLSCPFYLPLLHSALPTPLILSIYILSFIHSFLIQSSIHPFSICTSMHFFPIRFLNLRFPRLPIPHSQLFVPLSLHLLLSFHSLFYRLWNALPADCTVNALKPGKCGPTTAINIATHTSTCLLSVCQRCSPTTSLSPVGRSVRRRLCPLRKRDENSFQRMPFE